MSFFGLIVSGCAPNGWSSPTVTPVATVTPTATPVNLPDLGVKSLAFQTETDEPCYDLSNSLGVQIEVVNNGVADASSFFVDLNGEEQFFEAGLPVGQTMSMWFPEYSEENYVFVDSTNLIVESDEENNYFHRVVAIPTMPPLLLSYS